MAFRSGNPALNAKSFEELRSADASQTMTIEGTVNKTGILLLVVIMAASLVWYTAMPLLRDGYFPAWLWPVTIGGAIIGFIFAMITTIKKTAAPITAPIYAIFEGLFLGGISAIYAAQYEGIVMQAVALTFGVFISLLVAYKSGLIKATENFKLGVTAATGGIFLLYVVSMVMNMFGAQTSFMHSSSLMSIGISGFIVVIAALNLVMDFDFIENAAEQNAPKYMEWYGAFGLLVTLVWLYLEILRLLSKLNRR